MDAVKNFAFGTVMTAPSPAASGTTIVLNSGEGAAFPAVPFNMVVCPANTLATNANAEIVRVTVLATDTLTVVRQQEISNARTIVVGDWCYVGVTLKTMQDMIGEWRARALTFMGA
jgi:hypothetical protein